MRIVLAYWWKGLKYAAMSLCAIYAGYVIQIKEIKEYKDLVSSDLGVLIIPALASACFFICYTIRFNPEESTDSDKAKPSVELWRIALWTFVIPAAFLAPLFLMVLASVLVKTYSPWLISAFVIHAGMYAYYGHFLVKRLRIESTRALRHQLFWAVILSIGFSLYYGYTFSQLSVSLSPLIPVAAITFLFFVDWLSGLERRVFVKSMAVIFFVFTLVVVLVKTIKPIPLGENFYTMMLCVAVSIYMAVFEAWVVTSQVEERRRASLRPDHPPTPFVDQKTFQYSAGTLSFLIVIIWIVPILFILSPYGGYFLLGFGIHAFFAFLIWYLFGLGKPLRTFKWGYLKAGMVLSFLVFLVSTKFFDTQPTDHFLAELVGLTPVFGFGACTFYTVQGLFRREHMRRRGDKEPNDLLVLTKRINFTRILSGMCFVAYVGLYLVLTLFAEKDSINRYKGEMTLSFYGICIILCAITELWHNRLSIFAKRLIKRVIRYFSKVFVGILFVSRVVPSTLLGLAVALPSLYRGVGIWRSCFSALPFFLSAIGAFALNDYCDIEKDKLNKPYRAIPSGKLSANFVLWYGIVLIASGFLGTFVFSRTKIEFILYLVCISGMTSYNIFVKHLSLSKTFLTATVSSMPLLFSVIVFDYPMIYVLLPIAACSFIIGREWLMDIRDVTGDAKGEIVTVPMIIGPAATTKLGFGLQLVAGSLLLPIAISSFSYWHFFLIAFVFLSTIGLYFLWSIGSGRFEQRVIRLLWIPMFCGLLFFIN
ncbi:MAG TPA: UbiA family prenyltransferase [Pyrinomonadaceae bacterium]